ncbi:MAG: hypothetical protein NW241_07520 [Bacteroidia bacterium]|nr:hypothetical protein [Bacteroidia bacterium]
MRALFIATALLLALSSCKLLDSHPADGSWTHVYAETQCSDAWNGSGIPDVSGTIAGVTAYLQANGISPSAVGVEVYAEGPFCAACQCPSGRRILVEVAAADADSLEALDGGLWIPY